MRCVSLFARDDYVLKMKYCPNCAGMDFRSSLGKEQCSRCRYAGPLEEGPIDEINALRKRLNGRTAGLPLTGEKDVPAEQAQALMERPSKDGPLPSAAAAAHENKGVRFGHAEMGAHMKSNAQLLRERLQKLKGTSNEHAEIF
ncbi:MAG: hypothetical protein HY393_00035 [Candidatus Diapherotrites archaeon]|nr:hypothetical protein [Candidatus Diapherotrites archaeon]